MLDFHHSNYVGWLKLAILGAFQGKNILKRQNRKIIILCHVERY